MDPQTNTPNPIQQSLTPAPNKKSLKLVKTLALTGVVIIVATMIGLSGVLVYKKLASNSDKNQVQPKPVDVIASLKVSELPDYYYYVTDYETAPEGIITIDFYKTSKDLTQKDVKINSLKVSNANHIIAKSWQKDTLLLKTETPTSYVIQSLELSLNAQPQTILELSKDLQNEIFDARLLNNGKTLAYITYATVNPKETKNIILHIQNLDESTVKSIPLADTLGLYTGFRFVDKSPDGNTIYLSEGGGDGGAAWAVWHKVNLDTQKVEKLENLPIVSKVTNNPVYTVINPSATYAAYIDVSGAFDEADLEKPGSEETLSGCLDYDADGVLQKYANTGGLVVTRNLESGEIQEIYRNLTYGNNVCLNIARRIISILWIDDKTLAVETIDGIYSLDIETKKGEQLFRFRNTVSPGKVVRPGLTSLEPPFILFDDASIGIMGSNNLVQYLSQEAQESAFFSLNQFE